MESQTMRCPLHLRRERVASLSRQRLEAQPPADDGAVVRLRTTRVHGGLLVRSRTSGAAFQAITTDLQLGRRQNRQVA
jgi:hypothetical protein